MLKKIGKIGLAFILVIGLLPMISLRAYAATPSFTKTVDFPIQSPVTNASGKNVSDVDILPGGSTAVVLNTFAYQGDSPVYTYFLKVFDSAGAPKTDVPLSNLMDTYYQMTDVNMLALSDGRILITYHKSDSNAGNLQLGTVKESTPNAYFMVLNQSGQKVVGQTQINTFSASSPALTRFVSITELSDGNVAFSWQRNDNISTATRVFSVTGNPVSGTPVSSETLLVQYVASMSYVSAGDGVYMVAYNSGPGTDRIFLKIFSNNGTLLKTIDEGIRTDEKQLFLSTLNNGNFMFSQYNYRTNSSTVSLYDKDGTRKGGFTVSGYLGESSAAIYRDGVNPGFVTVSTDSASTDAINDAYNNGKEWSGTQYVYLNYYDNDGNLVFSSDQPVDSAPVVMQGYNEDTWMYAVEYYPSFRLYPTFGDNLVLVTTDNTDADHYRITAKIFEKGSPAPAASIDYSAEQLTGLTPNSAYSVNNGTGVTATADGTLAIDSSWLGTSLSIVKKGNGSTTTDSPAQTLSIPSRPGEPTGVTATDETAIGAEDGTMANLTTAMEYKQGVAGTWTDVSGATVTRLVPDTYYVRTKATAADFASEAKSVTVAAFVATPEATPAAIIDYAAEQLTGLTASGSYTVNGTAVTATIDGKLDINSAWLGTPLSIVKKGNSLTTTDSPAQTLSIPSRAGAPTGVIATDETEISANNGTLTNVTTAMEYKKGTAGVWTNVPGAIVDELVPDTYYVRTKATVDAFASEAQSATVATFVPTPEAAPIASIDYATEQLTGLTASGSYTVNGALVTASIDGELTIDSSWLGTSLSIVKKGNSSTTTDSTAQTLSIPIRPVAPIGITATDETAINANNGTLKNVTTEMEYKQGMAGAWKDVPGVTVTELTPDTYHVRTKATATAFASASVQVAVVAFVATPEVVPSAVIDYIAEQLTGLTPNGSYTVNGALVTATAGGKLAIESSWLGTSLSIVKKGNGSTTTDSVAQTLSIPSRSVAPTGVTATDETAISANDGTLTNVTTAMEYKKGTAGAWTVVPGTSVTGLKPDTYYVRTKATVTVFASEAQSVTVATFVATPEATPAAVIDYAAEQLTGLTPSGLYIVNGTTVTATADGKLEIDSSWLGTSLSILKKGDGSTTADSAVQTLSISSRAAAPVGVTVTDVTYNGANNGIIHNLTVLMEYKIGSTGLWTEVTDTTITDLAPDTYYVREKATATAFASIAAQITVHDSNAVIPSAPEVTADDQNNTIVGLDTSMEFSLDDGPYVRYDGTNLPDLGGEHIVKVRVVASGSVPAGPATTLTFTINLLIPAGGLNVSAIDPSGSANNGYTQITVTPALTEGHMFFYKNFGAGSVVVPNVGDVLTGYNLVGSEGLVPAANGDTIGIAEVDADGKAVKYGSATATVAADTLTPGTDPVRPETGGNSNSGMTPGNANIVVTDVIVLVNGKEENAGTATTTTLGNVGTTIIVVDPAKLQAKLNAEGNGAVVTVPVTLDSNIIVAELNGQMIKNMENASATLVFQTNKGTYTLAANEINIGALVEKLGKGLKLEDITLKITISETSPSMNQVVAGAASRGGFTLVSPSLDFSVTATYGTSTVEVSQFNAYVERIVALPDGIDPNRITTGVVVEPDGSVRHVPTRFVLKDGKYYAVIKSVTNSSYSVIWHPLTFADVENHWAKDAVNDMGSRLVINGVNKTTFNPNADITRAEFAAIIVRGLGLKLGEGKIAFTDVPANSWYAGAVETASEYGLITGFEDGTFQPNAPITREQAMNIIAKAMKLTGLADQTGTVDATSVLAAFTDTGNIGVWAKDSLALAVKAGLISGRGDNKLEAKANVTRAEVAVLIQRLLQKSGLID